METLLKPIFIRRDSCLWLIIPFQISLICLTVIFPYYAVPLFILGLLVLAAVSYPELSYYIYLSFITCQLITLQIVNAHSVPLRIMYMDGVPIESVGLPVIVSESLVLGATFCWIFARMAKARPGYVKTPLDLYMAAFFGWVLCSLLWSPDLDMGLLKIFVLTCCYLGFFLSATLIRTKKILHTVIWIWIFAGIINSIVAVYSLFNDPVFIELYRKENISVFFSFIHMAKERGMGLSYCQSTAYFLNIAIILALGLFCVAKDAKKRFFIGSSILLMAFGHLTTSSKAGLFGLLCGICFFIIAHKRLRLRTIFVIVLILVVFKILSMAVYSIWPWPEKAMLSLPRKSLFPRMIIWGAGFENLIETNGLGYGAGSFFPAHSIFFSVLFETGIIGGLIWIGLLIKLFRTIRASLKRMLDHYYRTMILAFTAVMISIFSFGLYDILYAEEAMWVNLGLGMAVIRMSRNRYSQENYDE